MPSPKSGDPGSAISPTEPKEADEADAANPGEVEKAKAEQRQTQTGKYGSAKSEPHRPPGEEEQDQDEEKKKNSWVEIKLVDAEGRPVPGEPYRVTLPDNTVAEGALDENGFARIEGFDPGDCQVTFPNRDKGCWNPQ